MLVITYCMTGPVKVTKSIIVLGTYGSFIFIFYPAKDKRRHDK